MKQVSFDQTCQLIPDTDCKELRKLITLASRRPCANAAANGEGAKRSFSINSGRLAKWSGLETNSVANSIFSAATPKQHSVATTKPALDSSSPSRRAASTSQITSVDFDEIEQRYRKSGFSPLRLANEDPGLARVKPVKKVGAALLRSNSLSVTARKSCLLRHQAPMAAKVHATAVASKSDAETQRQRRRRAMGPPIVARPPFSERKEAIEQNLASQHNRASSPDSIKSQMSDKNWKRFRRAASEGPSKGELSTLRSHLHQTPLSLAEASREILAGRWPFELPLNSECSCKDCQVKIDSGLADGYQPPWTKAARIKWLEAQEDAKPLDSGPTVGLGLLWRSTSRSSIQADEVDKLRGESITPMTSAELEAETASPLSEQPQSPCGPLSTDDVLRQEIAAKRNSLPRLNTSCRPGARSMMRQLEEAERRESEAVHERSRSRQEGSQQSTPSLSVASPPIASPSTTSTSPTSPSYFDIPVRPHSADPSQTLRRKQVSPTDKSPFSMSTLLRALGTDAKSPASSSASRLSSMFR